MKAIYLIQIFLDSQILAMLTRTAFRDRAILVTEILSNDSVYQEITY